MKKRLLKLVLLLLLASGAAYAQTVSGKVTSATDGSPVPGVSILVKGTTTGTSTDANGRFTLSADPNSTLVVSFIGFKTQEVPVGIRTSLDISLVEDVTELNEVVVTALGIEKETKALGYSVSNVKGDEFTKAREINVANALVGKIAGVNSAAPATGPGGSSRVTIRGNSSLIYDNQPLYVINGIQMNTENLGSAGQWGGADVGDGISSINPDDIESITVLKGGAAAALYGQRGRNGVILITTKSGRKGQGLGIEFNSNTTVDQINNFTDWQTVYGQGTQGLKSDGVDASKNNAFSSWGAQLDGSNVTLFDGKQHPYSRVNQNNMDDFYQTGKTYNNTLSISAGNEAGAFRLSAGTLRNSSVYRNSEFNRTTLNLDANYNLSKQWSTKVNMNYTKEDGNRSNLSDSPGNGNYAILFLPANINGAYMAPGYDDNGNEIEYNSNAFDTNPYFAAAKFRNNTTKDRILSVASIRFAPAEWIYFQARVANDYFNFNRESITPTGTAYRRGGSLDAQNFWNFNETNSDILVGLNKELMQDLSIGVTIGANLLQQRSKRLDVSASELSFPFLYNPGLAATRNANLSEPQKEVQSIYGSLEVSYKDRLFLTITDRNDWSSTLPMDNNSYNYPSVNASYVFSESLDLPWLSLGKLRAGYARVGGDAPVFSTSLYYSTRGAINGQPIGDLPNEIPNKALEPLQIKEIEFGTNLQLFDNRAFIDAAWYKKETLNDIVPVTVTQSTGYDGAILNVGELRNEGIELLIGGTPVKTSNFSWTTSFNYSNNKNTVVKLSGELERMPVPGGASRTQRGSISHVVGERYAQVMVYDFRRDDSGNLILDESGLPLPDDLPVSAGTGIHPITGGWNNDITFKNFTLSFLIDFKSGAVIYSGTNARAYQFGLHKETLKGREEGIVVSGVDDEGNAVTGTVSAQDYYTRLFQISKTHVYDADFIKFRSLSLTYNFGSLLGGKVKELSVSLVGRNLFYIKKKSDNIDPEANYTTSNAQGLEYAALPTVRTYGINLNAKF